MAGTIGTNKVKRMKTSRRALLSLAAWLVTATAIASAQVIKQIPSDAIGLVKVSDLETTSKKVADFCTQMGITQLSPDMSDPLGAALKSIGITDGINRSGEFALVFLDPTTYTTTSDKSLLMLIPVADYQKFIGNFSDAKPDGDLTQVHFKGDAEQTFVAHWGDYAACSPTRAIVTTAPTETIQVTGLAAKELDGKDIVAMANLKAIRAKGLQKIDSLRQDLSADIDRLVKQGARTQHVDASKYAPLANVAATQALDLAQKILEGINAASLSVNLSPDGIATTLMCQFDPGSVCDGYLQKIKNTDDSMLEGLGNTKYLLYGGSSPQQIANSLATFLAPIEKQITDLGPQYAPINDWLNAVQKLAAASQGQSYGVLMPTAQPGAGALIEAVNVRRGDAKGMLEATREMADAQQAVFKSLNVQLPNGSQTYTRESKTVDGISFDEIKGQVNLTGQSPQEMQIMQAMTMLYGPQGPDVFTGIVNDQTVLTVTGLDDAAISSAIAAAKSGDDPLAKTMSVKSVAGQLPAERFAVTYVPLDLWATTGFGYAKMFGLDMNVTLPENLPPMGMTLSTEGSAIRGDTYLPSQLIQALTSAGMQVYMKTQNPPANNGGGGAGGGAPGGL